MQTSGHRPEPPLALRSVNVRNAITDSTGGSNRLINALTGAELVPVPYAGAAPAIAALRGEHIEGVMQAPKEIYCSRAAAAARASGTTS